MDIYTSVRNTKIKLNNIKDVLCFVDDSVDNSNVFFLQYNMNNGTARRVVFNPNTQLIRYYTIAADGTETLLMEK